MIALALALGLAAAGGPGDTDLPRSLDLDETRRFRPRRTIKDDVDVIGHGKLQHLRALRHYR